MEDNIVKERISEAFFNLLMAKNRFKVYSSTSGDDGVDLTVGPLRQYTSRTGPKSRIDNGQRLDIQLKCTTESMIRKKNGSVTYDLRVKNYEDLIERRDNGGYIKLILVLFILPDDELDWLYILEDHVKLAKHAFWFYPSEEYTIYKVSVTSSKNSTIAVDLLDRNRLEIDFTSIWEELYAI